MKSKIATAILALFVLVAFSGCAQTQKPAEKAGASGTEDKAGGTAELTEQQVDQLLQDASDLETGANAMDPNVGDSGVDDSTFS